MDAISDMPLTVNVGRNRSGQIATVPVTHKNRPTRYIHPQVVFTLRSALAKIVRDAPGTDAAAIAERALRDTAL